MTTDLPGARYGGHVVDGGPVVRCDPDAIHAESMRVLNRARVLREAHATTAGLTHAARWESPAGAAFGEALAQVRPVLLEVADRFEAGGAVLREYAHEARRVQARLQQLSGDLLTVENELDALVNLDDDTLDEGERRAVLRRYGALSPQVTELMTARQQVYEEFLAYDRSAAHRLDAASAAHLANPRDYDVAEALQRLQSQTGTVLGLAGDYGGPAGEAAVEVAKKPETVLVAGEVAGSLYLRARYKKGSYRGIASSTGFTLTERVLTKRLTRVVSNGLRPPRASASGAGAGRGPVASTPGASTVVSPVARRVRATGRAVRGQITQTAEAKAVRQVGALTWSITHRGIQPGQRTVVVAAAGAVTAIHAVKGARSAQEHLATARSRAAHLRRSEREENPSR